MPQGDQEKIDMAFKIEDRKMREDVFKKAQREAKNALKENIVGLDKKASAYQAVVAEVLINEPLNKKKAEWEKVSENLASRGATRGELITLRDEIAREMQEYPVIVKRYTEEMSKKGQGAEEIIAAMAKSEARVSKLAESFIEKNKYPQLFAAVKYSLGLADSANLQAKKEALAEVSKHIKSNSEAKDVAWMVVRFLDAKDKQEFGEFYMNGLSRPEAVKFVEEGNRMGVFDPKQMETLTKNSFSDQQKQQYGILWQAQNDFSQQAKNMVKETYGAKNAAGEMLTPANIGMFILQLASVSTIFANVAANIFRAGKLRNPKAALQAINVYSVGALGILGGIKMIKKGEPLSKAFMSKEERESQQRKEAALDLQAGIQNPQWKNFIQNEGFLGGQALWEYRNFLRRIVGENKELPDVKLSIGEFTKWLAIEKSAKAKPYEPLIEKLQALKSVDGQKADVEFANIMNAFDVYKLGETNLEQGIKSILKQK